MTIEIDKETAEILRDCLWANGEQKAAGAEYPPLNEDDERLLGIFFQKLSLQLKEFMANREKSDDVWNKSQPGIHWLIARALDGCPEWVLNPEKQKSGAYPYDVKMHIQSEGSDIQLELDGRKIQFDRSETRSYFIALCERFKFIEPEYYRLKRDDKWTEITDDPKSWPDGLHSSFKRRPVLVTGPDLHVSFGFHDLETNQWFVNTDNGQVIQQKITHWMHIPQPPRKENDGTH